MWWGYTREDRIRRAAELRAADGRLRPGPSKEITVDEAIEMIGYGPWQIRLMFTCGVNWMADAMEVLLLSFLLPAVGDEWALSDWEKASIGSTAFAGMLIGSVFWGIISDKYGRRIGYLSVCVFTAIFGFLGAFTQSYWQLLLTRCLAGFGLGGAPIPFGLFAEFLPIRSRGVNLMIFEVFWTVGAIFEAGLAWLIMPGGSWRWLLALSSVPLFILLALYPWLPESPRYLLITGQSDKAISVLYDAALANSASEFFGQKWHLAQLAATTDAADAQQRGRVQDLLRPGVRYTAAALLIMWFMDSLIYYGLVMYMVEYFKHRQPGAESGASSLQNPKVYIDVFISALSELPSIPIAIYLVDHVGRVKANAFLFLGTAVASLALMIPGQSIGLATAVSMVARMCIFGAFASTYIYTSEVFPTMIRSTALGVMGIASKLSGTVTPYIAEVLVNVWFTGPVFVYGIASLAAAAVAWTLPIETRGRSMPDSIDEMARLAKSSRAYASLTEVPVPNGDSASATPAAGSPVNGSGADHAGSGGDASLGMIENGIGDSVAVQQDDEEDDDDASALLQAAGSGIGVDESSRSRDHSAGQYHRLEEQPAASCSGGVGDADEGAPTQ